jgi:ParB-like chromosome segregation protein Spo0J
MRGLDRQTGSMFSYVSPEALVPADHPLRAIRKLSDAVFAELSPQFDKLYARMGRPSIAPEKLLRALLLQVLYSVRSERLLMEELNYTQEQVAERMGKERSTVANYIRLLKLPPDIQVAVRKSDISMGHARALINVDTVDKQLFIFNEIRSRGLSVRQTEDLVRKMYKSGPGAVKESVKSSLPPAYKKIEDNLATHFSTKVRLSHNKNGHGNISIEYYSIQELNKILDQIGVSA